MSRCQEMSAVRTFCGTTVTFFLSLIFFVQVRHFRGNVHSEEFLQRAAAANRAVDLIRWVINFFLETSLSDSIVRFHLRSRRIVTGRVVDPDPHIKAKMLEFKILKMERGGGPWTRTVEAWRIYKNTCGRRFSSL